MRIVVTGGAGFIGSRLARALREQGHSVKVFTQCNSDVESQNVKRLETLGVKILLGSVTEMDAVRDVVDDVDILFHLAAAQHEANRPNQHFHDVNVKGTRNLLRAAAEAGVGRFVHGSTIGVYGMNGRGPVHDDSPPAPDNIYGVTKLEGEKVARQFGKQLPVAIVRISETYGPGDRRLLKLFRGIQKRRFFHIGSGRNLHHLIYIDDLIDALWRTATTPCAPGETYVLAGPVAVTTNEMIAGICQAVAAGAPKLRVPLWPLMASAVVMEGGLRPCGIQPPLHRRRMNFFVKSFQFTCEKARGELGFQPQVGFAEGARRTAQWYEQMNLL